MSEEPTTAPEPRPEGVSEPPRPAPAAPSGSTPPEQAETVAANTVADKTVADNTAAGSTAVDRTEVEKTAVDKTAVDDTAVETAVDESARVATTRVQAEPDPPAPTVEDKTPLQSTVTAQPPQPVTPAPAPAPAPVAPAAPPAPFAPPGPAQTPALPAVVPPASAAPPPLPPRPAPPQPTPAQPTVPQAAWPQFTSPQPQPPQPAPPQPMPSHPAPPQPPPPQPAPPPGPNWNQYPAPSYGQAPPQNWPAPPGWQPPPQQNHPGAPTWPQNPAALGQPGQAAPLVPVQPAAPVPMQSAGYGMPMVHGQYDAPVAPGTYPYPIVGQIPGVGPAPVKQRRKLPKWMMYGIPGLVVVIVASILVALNIDNGPNPAVNKVQCAPGSLVSCLIEPPAGAGKNSSSWATSTSVDATAYASAYADAAATQQPSEVSSLVTGDGLKSIAHRSWYQGSNQIDLILLQFTSPQGAQAWADDRTGDFLALDSGPDISLPANPGGRAYTTASPDGAGDIDVRYITTVGAIDFEAHYASQGTLQQQDFDIWAGAEYSSLQTAPAPAPTPSPSATAFQAATCPGSLTSCLMPFPSGGSTVPGLPSTYSVTAFANDFITKNDAPSAITKMQSDHVVGIDSEAWATNNFADAAQLIVLQTRTDAQAQDLMTSLGGDADYTSSFEIPGYSSAIGRYSNKADAQGFYEGLVYAQTGTIYVNLWLSFQNSFDTATTQSWAVTELNLLGQNTQNHWGFPIPQVTTPSLAPFQAGTCSAATAVGCMMAVPSGSTSTSTGGAPAVRAMTVSDLVGALYSDRQNYEQAWLNADGAKSAATESWTAANNVSATDYVVLFDSARHAQAAAQQQIGDSANSSQSCSVPSLPNLSCLVMPADNSSGAVPIRITAWSGKYELDLEVSQTDAADTADALAWAQAQLQMLAGG